MPHLEFDFNNMQDFNIGAKHGVREKELKGMSSIVQKAHNHLRSLIGNRDSRINVGLEWTQLPFQDRTSIKNIQKLGKEISEKYENVIFLGIGGSYLGLKAAQDALCQPYYNEIGSLRRSRARIYFEGNNLDPEPLKALLKNLDPKKTFVVVISKSGETTETKAGLHVIENWLRNGAGKRYSRQIFAITDHISGSLRKKVDEAQQRDILSFRNLTLFKGVGGRYSELNMGLLHLAIIGVKITDVLAGAKAMADRCSTGSLRRNPAYMYATLQTILYRKKAKSISVIMPFSEGLKSTADWYTQLLAESLGKKYRRRIMKDSAGLEVWSHDESRILNIGRTPVPCRGTNDLHSIQQNNIEGENNKTITFIRVGNFREDINIPRTDDFLRGRQYSRLITLAHEATEWALTREKRPNCTIYMPEVSPYNWGELIYFFEMATAFEGELLNVNAFDQPGVESYKNYMYYKLHKPGISRLIAEEIKAHPIARKKAFVI